MTTMSDLIADTRRMVYGSMNDQINLIDVDAAAGSTTLVLELSVTGITPGMVLSSGLNVWYVKGVSLNDNNVFVIPGYDNSPQNAVSAGDMVFIKPRMTDWYAFGILNDEIRSLSSPNAGLYKIGFWTVNSDSTYQTYDIPLANRDLMSLARVRYRIPGTPDQWVDLPTVSWRWQADQNRIQLLRNVPSSTEVQFVYKAPFSVATALDDDIVEDCGLAETMVDIPVLGAASMLLRTTENRRNQITVQGDSRRSDEVVSGGNSSAADGMARMYRDRVNQEYIRLTSRTPIFKGI
jgi:hypothetical protein